MKSGYEVFISFKSEDQQLAQEVHRYLTSRKLNVFCSGVSLAQMGTADFRAAIDSALDSSRLLIVLATSAETLTSRWVNYEWTTFHTEIISNRKPGGSVFVYGRNIEPGSLPLALRQSQIIYHGDGSLEQLYAFISNALQNIPGASHVEESVATEPPKVSSSEITGLKDLIELIERGRGGVAAPPADLMPAIAKGLAEVDQLIMQLASQRREIGLEDVEQVTSLAIGHGAGIYNHSAAGRAGCAQIYLRAAAGLAAHAPNPDAAEAARPAKDAALALRWLNRIASESPFVRDEQADDLAWELRFAFDSISSIPPLDSVQDALALAMHQTDCGIQVASVLGRVLGFCQQRISQQHVRAFFLRQTALVLAWMIETQQPKLPQSKALARSLEEIVQTNGRIGRANHAMVEMKLSKVLEAAIEAFSGKNDPPPAGHHRWTDPASWFRRN